MGRMGLVVVSLALWWGFACSGGKKIGMEANLLDYNEADMVTFTISGNATCEKCEEEELPIEAMQIEVYRKGDPVDRLAFKLTEGLGPFSISEIRAESETILEIRGTLMREGTSGYVTAYYGYGEVEVPDDDGDVVSLTLKFPSSEDEG